MAAQHWSIATFGKRAIPALWYWTWSFMNVSDDMKAGRTSLVAKKICLKMSRGGGFVSASHRRKMPSASRRLAIQWRSLSPVLSSPVGIHTKFGSSISSGGWSASHSNSSRVNITRSYWRPPRAAERSCSPTIRMQRLW